MQNILTLPLSQEPFLKSNHHEKIRTKESCAIIEIVKNNTVQESMHNLEELSVTKAKEVLKKMLLPTKEAVQIFSNLEQLRKAVKIFNERQRKEQLPANITETPKFHETKSEPVELSQSAKDTFTRIGFRAREAFIEEQIERAMFYNIPYKSYGDNYYQLMIDIDKYEYLLAQASMLGISWDDSIYDPVALEQVIEDQEEDGRKDRDYMYNDYIYSRRITI